MSPGALPSGGLVFQLVCSFPQILGIELKVHSSAQMESCFQGGACSVCFLLQGKKRLTCGPQCGEGSRVLCTCVLCSRGRQRCSWEMPGPW